MAMDPAGREQAENMDSPPIGCSAVEVGDQGRVFKKASLFDGLTDPGELLRDKAACAQMHMADLGIAHVFIRQTHIEARAAEQGVWVKGPEIVPYRFMGTVYGIVFGDVAMTPAVQYNQDQGPVSDRRHYAPLSSRRVKRGDYSLLLNKGARLRPWVKNGKMKSQCNMRPI